MLKEIGSFPVDPPYTLGEIMPYVRDGIYEVRHLFFPIKWHALRPARWLRLLGYTSTKLTAEEIEKLVPD